jgi:hypothetical protein
MSVLHRRDEIADHDLLGELVLGELVLGEQVLGSPGLVLLDGQRLQPGIVSLGVVHEPHGRDVRLDDGDLLHGRHDQQLQAEPTEQLEREPRRLVRTPPERLVDDREAERP